MGPPVPEGHPPALLPRTHGAVCATPATWVMDCSVWRSPSRPWTAAWASPHRVTWMPCAPTCTSRVCFPACPRACACRGVPADCVSLPSAEKWAGVFHLQAPSGTYGLNFSEAEAACGAQGAVLASLLQLSAAQQVRGAQEHGAKPVGTPGVGPWVSTSPPTPTAGLPPVPCGLAGQRLGCPPRRFP